MASDFSWSIHPVKFNMLNTSEGPVILAAFANDHSNAAHFLRNLSEEARRIQSVLEPAHKLCPLVLLPNATLEEILDAFKRKISGMFGGGQGIDDATLTSIAKSFMENEKGKKEQQEIADDIMFNKVFSAMYEKVSVTEQYLTMEEFSEMNRLANEAAKVSQEGVTELQDNMEDELGEGEES